MDNHEDFYCGECLFFSELYDKRRNTTREWCIKFNHRAEYENAGCPGFELDEEGERYE